MDEISALRKKLQETNVLLDHTREDASLMYKALMAISCGDDINEREEMIDHATDTICQVIQRKEKLFNDLHKGGTLASGG